MRLAVGMTSVFSSEVEYLLLAMHPLCTDPRGTDTVRFRVALSRPSICVPKF